jgi:hypothetical protein
MYTKYGYEVRQLPDFAWQELNRFWQENKHKMEIEMYDVFGRNIYPPLRSFSFSFSIFYDLHSFFKICSWDDPANHHVNHWEAPSYTVFLPQRVINKLIQAIKPILEVPSVFIKSPFRFLILSQL